MSPPVLNRVHLCPCDTVRHASPRSRTGLLYQLMLNETAPASTLLSSRASKQSDGNLWYYTPGRFVVQKQKKREKVKKMNNICPVSLPLTWPGIEQFLKRERALRHSLCLLFFSHAVSERVVYVASLASAPSSLPFSTRFAAAHFLRGVSKTAVGLRPTAKQISLFFFVRTSGVGKGLWKGTPAEISQIRVKQKVELTNTRRAASNRVTY